MSKTDTAQVTESRPLIHELITAVRGFDECRVKLAQIRGECDVLFTPPEGDSLTQLIFHAQWLSREILNRVEALEQDLGRIL